MNASQIGTTIRESSISREKARSVLASLGRADEWDESQDYYLAFDPDGGEFLRGYGYDDALAENKSNTSWTSPGVP